MNEVILSRIRQEAYEQGYQDGKVDGYNLSGTRMSSAKQERKKGKWIDEDEMTCSVCGFECDDPYYLGDANYCPNCGADMRDNNDD